MEYILCLQSIEQSDIALAGGKAANLGALVRANLLVPHAFVVLTSAYQEFLIANNLQTTITELAERVNPLEPDAFEQAFQSIRLLIEQGTMPEELADAILAAYTQMGGGAVAVRSSSTAEDLPGASFAGQQESYLNIDGSEQLLEAIKRCWSSRWTARAMAYRAQQGIRPESASMAVIVRQEELPVPGDDAWDRHGAVEIHDYDLWTRTNIGENFLEPITPLSETLWPTFFVLCRLPSREERGPDSPPLPTIGERFYGRMYVNEGAVIDGTVKRGIPTSFIDTTWGSSERGLRSSDDTIHFFRLLGSIPSLIGSVVKSGRQQPKAKAKQKKQKTPRLTSEQLYAQIDEWVEQFQQQDMQQLDDRALWSFVPLWIERGKALRPILLDAGLAGITFYFLERRVSKWTGKRGQTSVLVQALSGVYTAEVGLALWRMAQTLRHTHLDEIVQNHPAREALARIHQTPRPCPYRTGAASSRHYPFRFSRFTR
ncbi:MAG TPA: PEP/pyruvate-binding domain-containing protein [Ktedonobacteraceae bacterium]|nr:PEP/pyruvate-binding domain-containing protein [Ktedonobacteraceae bacterium]